MAFYVVWDTAGKKTNPTKIHCSTCTYAQTRMKLAKNGGWSSELSTYQEAYEWAMGHKGEPATVNCRVCHPETFK